MHVPQSVDIFIIIILLLYLLFIYMYRIFIICMYYVSTCVFCFFVLFNLPTRLCNIVEKLLDASSKRKGDVKTFVEFYKQKVLFEEKIFQRTMTEGSIRYNTYREIVQKKRDVINPFLQDGEKNRSMITKTSFLRNVKRNNFIFF